MNVTPTTQPTRAPIAMPLDPIDTDDPIDGMTALEVLGALRDEAAVTHQDPDGDRIDGDDAVRTLHLRGWDLRASSAVRAAMERLGLFRTLFVMLEAFFVYASADSRDDVRAALETMLTALRQFLAGRVDQSALAGAAHGLEALLGSEHDTAASAFQLIAGGVNTASDFTLPYRTHLSLLVLEREVGLEGVVAIVRDMEARFNAEPERTATGVLADATGRGWFPVDDPDAAEPRTEGRRLYLDTVTAETNSTPELVATLETITSVEPSAVTELVADISARLRERPDRSPVCALVDIAIADAETPEQATELQRRFAEVATAALLESHGLLVAPECSVDTCDAELAWNLAPRLLSAHQHRPGMPILSVAEALAEAADLGYEPQDLEMSAEIGSIDLVASLIVTDAIERGVTTPEIKTTMLGAMVDTLRPMIDAMPAAVRLLAYVEAGHDDLSTFTMNDPELDGLLRAQDPTIETVESIGYALLTEDEEGLRRMLAWALRWAGYADEDLARAAVETLFTELAAKGGA